jgi:hypothetical protein
MQIIMDKQEIFYVFAFLVVFLITCHRSQFEDSFIQWNSRLESFYFNFSFLFHWKTSIFWIDSFASCLAVVRLVFKHMSMQRSNETVAVIRRFSVLDLFGSILSCRHYRNNVKVDKSWIESLVACSLLQFGGTTLTGK